jgi:hypothetical protein
MNQVPLLCTGELMCGCNGGMSSSAILFSSVYFILATRWSCIGEIPSSMWLDVCDIQFLQNKCFVQYLSKNIAFDFFI